MGARGPRARGILTAHPGDNSVGITLRPARPDDLAALRRVCLLTGDLGRDATGRWSDDGLLADLFLEPYLRFAPEWALVAAVPGDPDTPVGFLVAVPDTDAFVAWWREVWTPELARRQPPDRPRSTAEAELLARATAPESMRPPGTGAHPAHLHIDLLPEAQRRGVGRRLVDALVDRLAAAGVPGAHLEIDPAHTGAAAFYERTGFRRTVPGGAVFVRDAVGGEARRADPLS